MSELILNEARPRPGRGSRGWLEPILLASLAAHLLLLAIVYFARRIPTQIVEVPDQPGYALVWDKGQRRPDAVPVPGRFLSMPNGENIRNSLPSPQSRERREQAQQQAMLQPRTAPQPPAAAPPAPDQPAESGEAPPRVKAPPRRARPHRVTPPQSSPFAHPRELSFASVARPAMRNGLHNSKSIDLSMGLLIQGGQLRESVPHVSSPGADGDYLEQLSEYVETHKFYPARAAANGEDGVAVIRATITRDGTVRDVKLVESSGSRDLDLAWISMFRGKRLVPFPDDMREDQRDFTLSMDYELIFR